MNTKIILSLGSAILLATSLLASEAKEMKPENSAKSSNTKMMKNQRHGEGGFISKVMKLKLSDDQRAKIKEIVKQNMQNIPKISDAFGEKSFDKELYIKLSKDRKSYMIENIANMIEGIYNVLDDSQKKELRDSMNQKRMMGKNAPKKEN